MINDLIQLLIQEPIWFLPMVGVSIFGYILGRDIIKWLRNRK